MTLFNLSVDFCLTLPDGHLLCCNLCIFFRVSVFLKLVKYRLNKGYISVVKQRKTAELIFFIFFLFGQLNGNKNLSVSINVFGIYVAHSASFLGNTFCCCYPLLSSIRFGLFHSIIIYSLSMMYIYSEIFYEFPGTFCIMK